MKLFELIEAECENVVIQRLGRAAEKTLQCGFIADGIAGIDGNTTPHVPSGFAFDAHMRVADDQIEPTAMGSAVERFVSFGASPLLEAEEHGTDECHERALAGFVGAVKDVESGRKRPPVLVVPHSETVNVNILDSHLDFTDWGNPGTHPRIRTSEFGGASLDFRS